MKDKRVYLRHILLCIADIEEFTAAGRDLFEGSRLHQAAVMRTLQVWPSRRFIFLPKIRCSSRM